MLSALFEIGWNLLGLLFGLGVLTAAVAIVCLAITAMQGD